ncbi:MAG TPA: hypothetical protein DCM08_12445, partial [Microscillaceae bacterium]|nr:hypothetical protein [Microscillaceae bacterium]
FGDYVVIGKDTFASDTLAYGQSIGISISYLGVLLGQEGKLRRIYLYQPNILLKKTAKGERNWNIEIKKPDKKEKKKPSKPQRFTIQQIQIIDGQFKYQDDSLRLNLVLKGFNYNLQANLENEVSNLDTKLTIKQISYQSGQQKWLEKQLLEVQALLKIDRTRRELKIITNTFKINRFVFALSGGIQQQDSLSWMVNVQFASKGNQFKNFISLFPNLYTANFDKIKAEGLLNFDGFVKGLFNPQKGIFPAFNFNLKISDGMFQYPELPKTVNNINLHAMLNNKGGNLQETVLNIKKMHLDVGDSPIDLSLQTEGILPVRIAAKSYAKLNLEDLSNAIPFQNLSMGGTLFWDAESKGTYLPGTQAPDIQATIVVKNANWGTPNNPLLLQKIFADLEVKNQAVAPENFSFLLRKLVFYTSTTDSVSIQAKGRQFFDMDWQWNMVGSIGLDEIGKANIWDSVKTSGKVSVNFSGIQNAQNWGIFGSLVLDAIQVQAATGEVYKIPKASISLKDKSLQCTDFPVFFQENQLQIRADFSQYWVQQWTNLRGKIGVQIVSLEVKDLLSPNRKSALDMLGKEASTRIRNCTIPIQFSDKGAFISAFAFELGSFKVEAQGNIQPDSQIDMQMKLNTATEALPRTTLMALNANADKSLLGASQVQIDIQATGDIRKPKIKRSIYALPD